MGLALVLNELGVGVALEGPGHWQPRLPLRVLDLLPLRKAVGGAGRTTCDHDLYLGSIPTALALLKAPNGETPAP